MTRLAFVAPKMDLVHPADRDRLQGLLRRMLGKYADNRDGLKHDYFNVAAITSTRVLPVEGTQRYLVGVPMRSADGRKIPPGDEQRFPVAELPADWPADWPAGRYRFPEVWPRMPPRKDYPPDQVNVDRLATFVIE